MAALHRPRSTSTWSAASTRSGGGIRTTFEAVPDAPVTKFVLEMQGGKKGLIVNSTNICRGKHRATAKLQRPERQALEFRPVVKAKCGGRRK